MKCDVCLTNIPLGQDTCPNCGYTIKPNHINTYDASGRSHEHIQVQSKYMQSRVNNIYDKPKKKNTLDRPKNKQLKKFIISMIIGIMVATIVIGVAAIVFTIDSFEEEIIEELSYQEVIDHGDDEDATIENAQLFEKDFVDYLKQHNYEDIRVEENVKDYDSILARTNIDAYKDDYHYSMTVSHQEGEIVEKRLVISGRFDGQINRTQFQLKEKEVKEITDYIGIDQAYQTLKSAHSKMEKDDNQYLYSNYDGPNLYLSEKYYKTSEPYYWFYYSIEIDY